MRAVIQRVSDAAVLIDNEIVADIGAGFLILLGVEVKDTEEDSNWLAKKISQLRVFSDDDGKMNNSIIDINGEVLVVSQFTLHAKIKKGNRPSYINAAKPELAIDLYQQFKKDLSSLIFREVYSGSFGANMQVSLTNDGPVTIVIDTKNRE